MTSPGLPVAGPVSVALEATPAENVTSAVALTSVAAASVPVAVNV